MKELDPFYQLLKSQACTGNQSLKRNNERDQTSEYSHVLNQCPTLNAEKDYFQLSSLAVDQ